MFDWSLIVTPPGYRSVTLLCGSRVFLFFGRADSQWVFGWSVIVTPPGYRSVRYCVVDRGIFIAEMLESEKNVKQRK